MDSKLVIADTVAWLERAVIGLNLCPFAKGVHVKGQVHYAVSMATTPQALLADLTRELQQLVAHDAQARDTTLLIAPCCLQDFLDFNDFLADADQALVDLDLDGVLQIASLHPQYQFAGTSVDDISNYTNRSPYPRPGQSLELLKELHILTREGKLNQDSRRKLKQVYHLFQFIEPLLLEAARHPAKAMPITLADHGAGKSYLGFILYDLFSRRWARAIYGIETRAELVERSRWRPAGL
jgi:hypothetical protein